MAFRAAINGTDPNKLESITSGTWTLEQGEETNENITERINNIHDNAPPPMGNAMHSYIVARVTNAPSGLARSRNAPLQSQKEPNGAIVH